MSSRTLFVTYLGLPACVVALVGVWSTLSNPSGGWVWPPDRVTISEAVATGDYAEVMRLMESGVDPNLAASVRADLLGGSPVQLTPAQAAVRARNAQMLRILLDGGVIVGPSRLAVLKCINDENGDRDVRALLDAIPSGPLPPCDQVTIP
ncbi:MAG: hypothetical protein ABL986_06700 [Vicinamibacterales bacterium]